MILIDDVVEVFAAPHQHVFPLGVFSAQKTQRLMARCVTVEGDLFAATAAGSWSMLF